MTSARRPLLALLPALALACGPDPKGDSATESSSTTDDPTTDDPTTGDPTTGDPTTGPAPAGCGGELEWTHSELGKSGAGARALAVAVDATGRIIVAGAEDEPGDRERPMLLALDPAGTELWRTILGGPRRADIIFDVVVDDDGRIFAAGREDIDGGTVYGMLRALSPDGAELWSFDEPDAEPAVSAEIGGLALGHGALYSAGAEFNVVVVRRHDPATGEVVWKTSHDDGLLSVYTPDVAVVGERVVVVAKLAFGNGEGHPFILQLDADGAIKSVDVDQQTPGWWLTVDAIGEGEILLAGEQYPPAGAGIAVRRAAPDGAEAWSTFFMPSPLEEEMWDTAVAVDRRIAIAGATISENSQKRIPSVRCLSGDTAGQWQAPFSFDAEAYEDDNAYGVAFGPGFMVAVGSRFDALHSLWVRKYALE